MYPPSNQTVSQLNPIATNITQSTFVLRIRMKYHMTNGVNNKNSNKNRHCNDTINTGMLNITNNWQLPRKTQYVPMVTDLHTAIILSHQLSVGTMTETTSMTVITSCTLTIKPSKSTIQDESYIKNTTIYTTDNTNMNTITKTPTLTPTTNTIIESFIYSEINIVKDNPDNNINGKNAAKRKEKALRQKKAAKYKTY